MHAFLPPSVNPPAPPPSSLLMIDHRLISIKLRVNVVVVTVCMLAINVSGILQ